MNTPVKLILGAVATGCIAVGIAAQVGSINLHGFGPAPTAPGAVEAQQTIASPSSMPSSSPSPSASPEPVQVPAPPPQTESGSPPKKKKHQGD